MFILENQLFVCSVKNNDHLVNTFASMCAVGSKTN